MSKLGLEKAEEPKIKFLTFAGSKRKQGNSRKASTCFIDYAKTFDCVHNKLWKTLKKMRIPVHLTCFLRKLYEGQEATVRTLYGKLIDSGLRKEYMGLSAVTCLFNRYAEHIVRKARLLELQAGIKIGGRNVYNLRYADDTTLMAESKEERKSFLMRLKEESERAGLRLNIKKTRIVVSGLITSWQVGGEEVEVVADFLFLGSEITANSDCSYETRRQLLLGRKAMTNLDSALKSSKGPYSRGYGLPSGHTWL